MRIAAAIVWALALTGTAHAQRTTSSPDWPLFASKLIPHCRIELADMDANRHSTGDAFQQGLCEGVVVTTIYHLFSPPHVTAVICPPANVVNNQALRVLVRYADAHPQELNDDVRTLAIRAFKQAWPCAKKPASP